MYNARLNTDSRRRPLNRVCPIFPSLWIAPVFTLPVGTDSPALSHMVYRHTVDLSSLGCSVPLGRKHRSDLIIGFPLGIQRSDPGLQFEILKQSDYEDAKSVIREKISLRLHSLSLDPAKRDKALIAAWKLGIDLD